MGSIAMYLKESSAFLFDGDSENGRVSWVVHNSRAQDLRVMMVARSIVSRHES